MRTYRWTRREYERMGEAGVFAPEARVELIEGEIVEMSPLGSRHTGAVRMAEELLRTIFGEGFDIRVQMPIDLGPKNQPEPDVAVVRGHYRDYIEAHPTAAETVLVVEVSDTTLAFDQTTKLAVYAEAGIAEYWIANLPEACVEIYREPKGTTYRAKQTVEAGDEIAPSERPQASAPVAELLP